MTDARGRFLVLAGADNFRDLGGYPTLDGRKTRWGRLFRSDALQELTASDVEVLRSVGLATVVDLRTSAEVGRHGRGLLAQEDLGYVHLSVVSDDRGESRGAPESPDLSERYLWYLRTRPEVIASAVRLAADAARHPLVFHCTAGKDRTGVVVALTLESLGVERDHVVADYAESASRIGLIRDRLRRDPAYAALMDRLPAERLTVEPATMVRFLERVDEEYGGASSFLRAAGIEEATVDRLRAALLEEPGSESTELSE